METTYQENQSKRRKLRSSSRYFNSFRLWSIASKKRIIIVGWKKEQDFGFPDFEKIIKQFTVNDAFEDLPKLKPGEGFRTTNYTIDHRLDEL